MEEYEYSDRIRNIKSNLNILKSDFDKLSIVIINKNKK
jgi:hypothetical protein